MADDRKKPGPDPERLVIESDPEEALGRLLGVHRPPDDLPEDEQPIRFWTEEGPPEGRQGIFYEKGKMADSEGMGWTFKEEGGKEYRHQVTRWQPLQR